MANWTTPAITTVYVDVISNLKDRDVDLAKMFDGVTTTNVPTGAIKWLSASSKFQKYNGVSWDDQLVSVAGGGTGAATAAAARVNLGCGTIATQNSDAVSITGGSIGTTAIAAVSTTFQIKDVADATKIARFVASAIVTATTADFTLPPASTTLVGTTSVQTMTNKTLTDCAVNTQAVGDSTTKAASTAFVQSAAPPGVIWAWPAAAAPAGFLLCYGQQISRTAFARLFSVIGTQFGGGDGSTTFNVPDLRGFVIAGLDNMGGATANRITSFVSSHTLGGSGGQQAHFGGLGCSVNVSGGIAGNTFGGLGGTFNTGGPDSQLSRGDQGGGTNVASQSHTHSVSVSVGGTLGVTGSFAGSGNGGTVGFNVCQPTMCFNYVIKY